jgi:hypothetical protein
MRRIDYITRTKTALVDTKHSSLSGKTVYNDDMTFALQLGKPTSNKREIKLYSIKAVRAVTTPVYGSAGKKIIQRLWPKGHEFVQAMINRGEIAEHIVTQLFPNVYNGTLKQFEASLK